MRLGNGEIPSISTTIFGSLKRSKGWPSFYANVLRSLDCVAAFDTMNFVDLDEIDWEIIALLELNIS